MPWPLVGHVLKRNPTPSRSQSFLDSGSSPERRKNAWYDWVRTAHQKTPSTMAPGILINLEYLSIIKAAHGARL